MKAKLDTGKIKEFFAHHIEKLAFIGCLAALGWFVLGAVSQEAYDKTPHDLLTQAEAAAKHMQDQHVKQHHEQIAKDLPNVVLRGQDGGLALHDYAAEARKSIDQEVAVRPLRPFNPPLRPEGLRRGQPQILPPRELHVAALNGAIGTRPDEDKDEREQKGVERRAISKIPKGVSVAVLTAFVPYDDQLVEYERVLANARKYDPAEDVPEYAGFVIERRSLVGGEASDWAPVELASAIAAEKQWADPPTDVIPKEWTDKVLTRPLPPLLGSRWSPDIVSHPRIKTGQETEQTAEPELEEPLTPDLEEPPEEGGVFGVFGGGDRQSEKPKKDDAPAPRDRKTDPSRAVTGRLFRWFDFTVKPGQQYEYRVLVGVNNPNYGIARRWLEKPEYAKEKYLKSEFSEPSPAVTVPDGRAILAGPVNPAKGAKEATAIAIVRIFSRPRARHLLKQFELERGQLCDEPSTTVGGIGPLEGKPKQLAGIDLETGFLLIDVRGGEELAAGVVEPGEMLIFDLEGRLMVRSELRDKAEFSQAQQELGTGTSAEEEEPKDPLDRKRRNPLDPLARDPLSR